MVIYLKNIKRSIVHKDDIKEAWRIKKSRNYEILSSKIPIIKIDNCCEFFLLINAILYKNKLYLKKKSFKIRRG
jgi:hypothetical protein